MEKEHRIIKDKHIIVAIGASAGGLEAINSFFDHAGIIKNASFIIIQHLSSDHKSFLVELVSKHTAMPVVEAINNMRIRKETVYVIPHKMMMTIVDTKLKLVEKNPEQITNTTIDFFLKSLAEDQKGNAVAIILSGTGTDGTKGIGYIKANGGKVIIQDPHSAKFDGMPNSAILSGNADVILQPETMAAWIDQQSQIAILPKPANITVTEEQMNMIFKTLQKQSGYDFQYYKTPTIIRRISKRMGMLGYSSLEKYIDFIKQDKTEAIELSKELFINVTSFFRDPDAFDIISKEVIPQMIKNKGEHDVIKIWVCACSTGEEAYTIAMLFDRYLQQHNIKIQVKIFATDIDESNILFASKNKYPRTVESSIPAEMLEDYFLLENNYYSVIPRIRKQIVFAKHNVVKDPAFIKNDMITCRNMLIYMNKILQEKILASFHFSLNNSGYLVLGSSESASVLKDGFEEINSKWKIYIKGRKLLPDIRSQKLPIGNLETLPRFTKTDRANSLSDQLSKDLEQAITEQLGYIALYIDNQYEIKETIGNYSRYLTLPQQKLKLNLLSMLPKELEIVLGNAIRRAWHGSKNVTLNNVPFKWSKSHYIDILIKPANIANNHTLVVICDAKEQIKHRDNQEQKYSPLDQHEYIKELEAQLTDTRDNLQLAIEGLETTNEELQSANEELLSSNEELQSSNEELQSLNEELHTLNTEHQAKIKELIELNDDLDNYLKSTDIGQIFLDSKLNIRRFNSNSCQFINLIETDIGRPISHISNNLKYDLLEDIKTVQATGKMVETEVNLQNGRISIVRIYPFIRKDKVQDGLVLTFIDVTDVKNLYGVVNGVFNSSLNSIIVLSAENDVKEGKIVDFKIDAVNYAAEELLGNTKEKLSNQSFKKMAPHLLKQDIWSKLIKVVNTGIPLNLDYYYDTSAGERFYDLSAVKINDGVMITYADITQKKNAEKRLKKNYDELIVTRESLKELNVRLEEEVADRTLELSMSEERFRLVSRATNDVIKDWNLGNNKVWSSESFFSQFSFNSDDVTDNIDFWFNHIHPEDIEDVKRGIFDAINTGAPQWMGEYRFENGKGTYGHVLERGYILKDEHGMPYRLISSLMDISALKKAEEATRELLLKKDEFMSIASHELKTPITSMKASLQIVQRIIEEKDSEVLALDFIHKANEQVDKLTTLVENLLDVTKIQAGKMAFNKSEFDMSELIDECAYHTQNLSRNPIHIDRNEAVYVFADQNRIEQVIMNLLSNAVKYSPDSTEIILNAYEQDGVLKVEIKDKGIGIAEENLPYVFDRFFRGINSSEKFSGLGLGLYISADIIRRHGGKVGVDSSLGNGSTFWFTIPLHHSTEKK